MRFKFFKANDMNNPIFKVGMIFESVVVLKRVVIEYTMNERVNIKFPMNEKKWLHVVCDNDCTWDLYGSVNSMSLGRVMKRYCDTHTCHKKWIVRRCTSRRLVDK